MARLDGFIFGDPGVYSLTVPYHDTNDFFYSGHVGTCFIIVLEYFAFGWTKMSLFTCFIMINQWFMMTAVRTHYIIDLITGLIFAHYIFIVSEKLSYFVDVKVVHLRNEHRSRWFFLPCKNCGWSNEYAGDFMSKEESK